MCGRFTIQYTWAEYHEALNLIPADAKGRNDPPRYNVCPGQTFGAVTRQEGEYKVIEPKWGLIPFWAKNTSRKPINARGETVHTNGMFKVAFSRKRCLIPANSYYEWIEPEPKKKLPYNIHLKNNDPFFFASIWGTHDTLDSPTCAIITLAPHDNIAHIHDRMPVILKRDAWEPWLDEETSKEDTLSLLHENLGEDLVAFRVSTAVNKNSNQGPELIEPVAE